LKDSTRARVAAIIGAASRGQSVSSVYDYSSGDHRNISVSINNGRVSGYDHTSSSHFMGDGGHGNLDFYDYETANNVQLKITENSFFGYDYKSGKPFSGTVSKDSLTLYDYETGQHYRYRVLQDAQDE
jgi:hypothetical protein